MSREEPEVNYWELSFERLAKSCHAVADSNSPDLPPELRAEAARLSTAWREGLALPAEGLEQAPRRANVLASLRKRTIEILIKIDSLR